MNVVFLSYHFPPSAAVGALRARKVVDALLSRGHKVQVIAGPTDETPTAAERNLAIHRVESAFDLRATYLRRTHRIPNDTPPPEQQGSGATTPVWTPPAATSLIKRQLSSALWLPDDRQGWIWPAHRKVVELARHEPIGLIYSSGPPFSTHLAALLAKRRIGTPLALEFRDPWTDNPAKPAFVRSGWSDATERWLESSCLHTADLVITVTESVAELLRNRLRGTAARKVEVVRNGIDQLDAEAPRSAAPVHRVVYTGNLYHGRDPRPFLRALAELRQSGCLPKGLEVEFIGECRQLLGVSIEAAVAELGLADVARFVDPLPHHVCIRRIRAADLLLLLAQQQPLQVPNKLYEYLGTRRPILAFADRAGETARMLKQAGGHYISDTDEPEQVRAVVLQAIQGRTAAPSPEADQVLQQWTSERQLALLLNALARIGA